MKHLKNKRYLLIFLLVITFCLIPLLNVRAIYDENAEDEILDGDIMKMSENLEEEYDSKFYSKMEDTVTLKKNIDGSSAVVGNNVNVNGNILGAAISFAQNMELNSTVDYFVAAGLTVEINGTVVNDAFVWGSTLVLHKGSIIGRDAILAGQDITISGNITRDLKIYAVNKVILKGATIEGNVTIDAPIIEIDDDTIINGKLRHVETADAEVSDEAKIGSVETFEQVIYTQTTQERIYEEVLSLSRMLVVFIIAVLLVPGFFAKIGKENTVGPTFLIGFAGLILIPILALVLAFSSFGLSLAFIIGTLYVLALSVSTIMTGYLLGKFIWNKYIQKEENPFMIGALGIILVKVLLALPYVGIFVAFSSIMFGLGSIIRPILLKDAR